MMELMFRLVHTEGGFFLPASITVSKIYGHRERLRDLKTGLSCKMLVLLLIRNANSNQLCGISSLKIPLLAVISGQGGIFNELTRLAVSSLNII